jgi:multicomponent K+:H+ antiporter subunit G
MLIDIVVSLLVLLGATFALLGSIGLARLPDFFTRLHAPTKATTLGVGALVVASLLHFSALADRTNVHEVAVTLFLFITAPVSAHMLAKAALHLQRRAGADDDTSAESNPGRAREDAGGTPGPSDSRPRRRGPR